MKFSTKAKGTLFILSLCLAQRSVSFEPVKEEKAGESVKYVRIYEWQLGEPPEYMPIIGIWEMQINENDIASNNKANTPDPIAIGYGEGMKMNICYRAGRKYYTSNPAGESKFLTSNTPFWWMGLPGNTWR